MTFKHRWAEGQFDRLPVLAADLIRRKVDVIAAVSGDVSIRAVMIANSAIPVVFITGSDPVESGLVPSFARPGGNITGFSMISNDLMSKRLELLSELVPQIRVISLLVNPNYHGATEGTIPLVQRARRGCSFISLGEQRGRFRSRLCLARPTEGRCTRRGHRPVLYKPTRADRGIGVALR